MPLFDCIEEIVVLTNDAFRHTSVDRISSDSIAGEFVRFIFNQNRPPSVLGNPGRR